MRLIAIARVLALIVLLLTGVVTLMSVAAVVRGDDSSGVRFAVCSNNISHVLVTTPKGSEESGPARLAITLDSAGTDQLRALTENHLGQPMEIVFDGAVLLRAPVVAHISSGKILSREWSSVTAAEEMAKLIGNNAIGAPCGQLPN